MCAHVYCRDELGQAMMPRGWQCKGVFWLPHRNLTLLDWETDTTGLGHVTFTLAFLLLIVAYCDAETQADWPVTCMVDVKGHLGFS